MKGLVLFCLPLACASSPPAPAARKAIVVASPAVASSAPPVPEPSPTPPAAPEFDVTLDDKPSGEWAGSHANAPVTPTDIWASGDLVIATGSGKILRSFDQGHHFSAIPGPGDQPAIWAPSPDDIYVAGDAVVRSTDRGETFTPVGKLPGSVYGIWGTANSDTLYAVGGSFPLAAFVARSIDRGATWTQLEIDVHGGWLYDVVGSPDGKEVVIVGKREVVDWHAHASHDASVILRSTDFGTTFTRVGAPTYPGMKHDALRKICITTSGKTYVTTAYGVFMSKDRMKSWKLVREGGGEILALACAGNRVVVGARNHNLGMSDDDGATWSKKGDELPLGNMLTAITAARVLPDGTTYLGAASYAPTGGGTLLRRAP